MKGLALVIGIILTGSVCLAADCDPNCRCLAWDKSPEFNVAGYYIFVGEKSREYNRIVQVVGRDITSYLLIDLPLWLGVRQYLAITAYTETKEQSPYSNEIDWIPVIGEPVIYLEKR